MAFWNKADVEDLKVGTIVKEPRHSYIGGVVKVRDGSVDVRWMKWDPNIEPPMLETLYAGGRILAMKRDDDETDDEFLRDVDWYLTRSLGRPMHAGEFIALMDEYSE